MYERILVPLVAANDSVREVVRRFRTSSPKVEVYYLDVIPRGVRGSEAHLRLESAAAHGVPLPETIVRQGNVLDELLSAAQELNVDLIIAGDAPKGDKHRSLVRRLAMQAPCSVMMTTGTALRGVSRILAPVDFSDCSADALRTAASLAVEWKAASVTPLHIYFEGAVATYEEHEVEAAESEDLSLQRFVARKAQARVLYEPMTVESPHIAETIVRVASEGKYDLIVMGTHGRSPSSAILLGSHAEKVFLESKVPVLGVKHFGAKMPLREAFRLWRARDTEPHFG
ncbi:MAG: universal stress protein [Acidobacteria bacterium]|nr:universal stress protein [Acidobacteriota bacterium]